MIILNKNNLTISVRRNVINCYKLLSRLIFGFFIVCLIPFTHAKNKHTQEAYLILKPKICIKESEFCQSTVEAEWKYLKPISACLYSNTIILNDKDLTGTSLSEEEEKIECWENAISGKIEFPVNTDIDLQITFQNLEKEVLLQAILRVMGKGIRVKHLRKKKVLWGDF